MGKNNLGMNQIPLEQLLPNTDQLLKLDELVNSFKTPMPAFDSKIMLEAFKTPMPVFDSKIMLEAFKTPMPVFDSKIMLEAFKIRMPVFDSKIMLEAFKIRMPVFDSKIMLEAFKIRMPVFDSKIIQEALRTVQIPSSTFQFLSTIDIEEIQTFLEEREVQEEIQQEITSIQEETSVKKVIDFINDWALKIMNAPTTLKEKAPAIYLISWIVLPFIAVNFLLPFVQDVWKEKVLHVSEFTEEKPKENAKQLKQSLEKDFGMALSAVNQIRVTNRETPVFRSHQRISGTIDSIPSNKPVIIIEKKRNWSFIMYINTLGEEVNGWVFTGNLAK
ncbi:hypothetical protein SZ39_4967 [Bacillus mycoides]|uniref:hypothetical protein n=1 Tax=Bacillus mycoides TaxID=1405 RepID=UPI0005CB7ACA|nr:hypothetical protein [Bacillus mycoides]KIV66056.1 hypothetical protein SZ39_4967 [Bacillus mycoides]